MYVRCSRPIVSIASFTLLFVVTFWCLFRVCVCVLVAFIDNIPFYGFTRKPARNGLFNHVFVPTSPLTSPPTPTITNHHRVEIKHIVVTTAAPDAWHAFRCWVYWTRLFVGLLAQLTRRKASIYFSLSVRCCCFFPSISGMAMKIRESRALNAAHRCRRNSWSGWIKWYGLVANEWCCVFYCSEHICHRKRCSVAFGMPLFNGVWFSCERVPFCSVWVCASV